MRVQTLTGSLVPCTQNERSQNHAHTQRNVQNKTQPKTKKQIDKLPHTFVHHTTATLAALRPAVHQPNLIPLIDIQRSAVTTRLRRTTPTPLNGMFSRQTLHAPPPAICQQQRQSSVCKVKTHTHLTPHHRKQRCVRVPPEVLCHDRRVTVMHVHFCPGAAPAKEPGLVAGAVSFARVCVCV
eukprot:GDKI01016678.1.p1 GENE.GDKI01016678.1~~GDKI01016678.1.p1  ORF type:complete len:182 (-),score=37.52 GDKI01016678.1:8-553(-)